MLRHFGSSHMGNSLDMGKMIDVNLKGKAKARTEQRKLKARADEDGWEKGDQ